MSFLWHGLTEEGAQVPVQVDSEGRVVAVDGTPGVSYWERTGTILSPAVPGDSVAITVSGGYNLSLNKSTGAVIGFDTSDASGGASIGYATSGQDLEFRLPAASGNPALIISDNQLARFSKASGFATTVLLTEDDGTTKIGGTLPAAPNITLNSNGGADAVKYFRVSSDDDRFAAYRITSASGNIIFDVAAKNATTTDNGSGALLRLHSNDENILSSAKITLDGSDGTGSFTGNVIAPNVTFRSADSRFYVKKTKNIDAVPEYIGPELDLLAEIARLEHLVRNLYECLRLVPPAGWDVWDGNDDVLRLLRK